jgi:hypothetical protein
MDDFINTLPADVQVALEEELITSTTQLRALSDTTLRALGLKLGDIARLRPAKRTREEEDDDDEGRQRRDAFSRARNTENLMAKGILSDPYETSRLSPKNWQLGLDHIEDRWRAVSRDVNPHTWEELRFAIRVAKLLDQDPAAASLAIWSRLIVLQGKIRFPLAAAEAEKSLEARLVNEREDIEAPGTQLRVALEFLRALSESKPRPPPQPNHNNNNNSNNKGLPGKPKGSFQPRKPWQNNNAKQPNDETSTPFNSNRQ